MGEKATYTAVDADSESGRIAAIWHRHESSPDHWPADGVCKTCPPFPDEAAV